ncbi:DUF3761 domain-containing protein [Mycobacterium sp. Marseille-P9652]|uniref:DUF3761 domain-containing protein n=1 Tax=Mycobacterium sp. Marseille-P9652 TaxID=2654950 RepID=UPI0012E7985D
MRLIATAVAALLTMGMTWAAPAPLSPSCDYVNVDNQCRPGPDHSQDGGGLELPCRDGTTSHATHRQGACSGHGGIAH